MTEIFLGNEALGEGLSRHELRRWYRPLFRGVYMPTGAKPSLGDRTLGAWLTTNRTGVVAGVAAAALHGSAWIDPDEPIELLSEHRRMQDGLILRADRYRDDEVTEIDGIRVTTAARTAFDMGRHQTQRGTALGRLDALMRAAPFTIEDVRSIMARYGPVRGVSQLRELLPLIDAGAASPTESWWRLFLIDNGFPAPETQLPVVDDDGVAFAYLDMGWQDLRLALEYDGDQHRTDRDQYVRDLRRLPRVEGLGWHVIRTIAEDRPHDVLRRVYEEWQRRGGPEIDKMVWASRTLPPRRTFRRGEGEEAA
ncbi:MAG: hypothetical protein U0R18_16850 [Mycobacterium sp.]